MPLSLRLRPQSHAAGTATYFREYLRQELSEWIKTQVNPEGEPYNLYRDGLKIYTTLDSRMQTYAEEAVRTQMKSLQSLFDEHWKGQDPWGEFTQILDQGMRSRIKIGPSRPFSGTLTNPPTSGSLHGKVLWIH
jgi:penicillin-binding protein 1A